MPLIIDAHLHYSTNDPPMAGLPRELGLKFLNVCVFHPGWRDKQLAIYRELGKQDPEHYAWVTTFDLPTPGDREYAQRVIAQLDADFADGAVGCKIWKNVGMELKDGEGRFVLPDDVVFEPIYAHLAKRGWTLLAHIAEPKACWEPLDFVSPHQGYYRQNPRWHMHGRTDAPDHGQLMAARDRVLEKHPKLRVVGAHLGSLEYDLKQIADRLDRYPNFAVDTSARLGDLAMKDREALIAFMTRYQDRILFGTDIGLWGNNPMEAIRTNIAMERAFYETDGAMEIAHQPTRGLALPESVLEKLYRANARAWYPGV